MFQANTVRWPRETLLEKMANQQARDIGPRLPQTPVILSLLNPLQAYGPKRSEP